MSKYIITVIVLSLVWSWPTNGNQAEWCFERPALDRDGQAADLDDCQLWRVIERANLRHHLQECEKNARQESLRIYGGFGFRFDLNPAGGIENSKRVSEK